MQVSYYNWNIVRASFQRNWWFLYFSNMADPMRNAHCSCYAIRRSYFRSVFARLTAQMVWLSLIDTKLLVICGNRFCGYVSMVVSGLFGLVSIGLFVYFSIQYFVSLFLVHQLRLTCRILLPNNINHLFRCWVHYRTMTHIINTSSLVHLFCVPSRDPLP